MPLIVDPYAAAFLIGAVALLILGGAAWLRSDGVRGGLWLAAASALGAVWAASLAAWVAGGAGPAAVAALRLSAGAGALLAWGVFGFVLHATRLLPRARLPAAIAALVLSLGVVGLAAGPAGGVALWAGFGAERSVTGAVLTLGRPSPYGVVAQLYLALLLLATASLLLAAALRAPAERRAPFAWLLGGIGVPLAAEGLGRLLGWLAPAAVPLPLGRLPWSGPLLAPAALAVAYGLFGRVRPRPAAAEAAASAPTPVPPARRAGPADELPFPVLRLDEDGRIGYANAATATVLARPGGVVGLSAEQVFQRLPALLAAIHARRAAAQEVELPQGSGVRSLEAWLTPLQEPSGRYAGALLTLLDIGGRRRAEAALEEEHAAGERRGLVLDALQEALRALGRGERLGLLLDIVLTSAASALQAPHAALYVLDPAEDVLRRRTAVGGFEAREAPPLRREEGPVGEAWASASVVATEALPADASGADGSGAEAFWAGASAAAPLRLGGRALGVIQLARQRGDHRPFESDEIDVLRRFAELAAIAVRDVAVRERAEQAEAELAWLDRLDAAILRGAPDTVVLDLALHAVRDTAGFERAVVWLPDDAGRALRASAWVGLTPGAESSQEVALDGSAPLLEDAFRGGHEVVLQGGGPLPARLRPRGPAAASPLMRAAWPVVLPLRGSRIVGVLVADDQDQGLQLEPRLRALRRIAARAAQALERASLGQESRCHAAATERARAQLGAALEAREALLDALPVAYFETDLRGDLTRASPELAELAGFDEKILVGLNLAELAAPGSEGTPAELFGRVLRSGRSARRASWSMTLRRSGPAAMELSIGLLRDPAGEPAGYFGLVLPRGR